MPDLLLKDYDDNGKLIAIPEEDGNGKIPKKLGAIQGLKDSPAALENIEEKAEAEKLEESFKQIPDDYVPSTDDLEEDVSKLEELSVLKEVDGRLSFAVQDKEVRFFIIRRLAEFCAPEDISKAVAKHLRFKIPVKDIAFIQAKLDGEDDFKAGWGFLRRLMKIHRDKFLTKLKSVPIANRMVRVQNLQNLYDGICKDSAQTERVPVIDSTTKKQKVTKDGTLVFKTIMQRSKRDSATAASILKQAAQEVGDWTDKVENHTIVGWAEMVKGMRSNKGLPPAGDQET